MQRSTWSLPSEKKKRKPGEEVPPNPLDVFDSRVPAPQLDARLGLRTYNEIRKSRGLQPFPDARFDQPILPNALSGEANSGH